MKKFILAITTLLYLTMAGGITVATHYCMGKTIGVGYAYRQQDKCSRCGMKNNAHCCHTEYKTIKTGDNEQWTSHTFISFPTEALVPYCLANLLQPVQGQGFATTADHHPPDPSPPIPIYLSQRVFRI